MSTKTEPKPKFDIAITKVYEKQRQIGFDCLNCSAFSGLEKYGLILDYTDKNGGYFLYVNGCYDFQEVIDYILANGGGYAE